MVYNMIIIYIWKSLMYDFFSLTIKNPNSQLTINRFLAIMIRKF